MSVFIELRARQALGANICSPLLFSADISEMRKDSYTSREIPSNENVGNMCELFWIDRRLAQATVTSQRHCPPRVALTGS